MTPDVKCDVCDEYIIGVVHFYADLLVCRTCHEDLDNLSPESKNKERILFLACTVGFGGMYLFTNFPLFLGLFILFAFMGVLLYIILPFICKEGSQ